MSGTRKSAAQRREEASTGNSGGTVARSSGGIANLRPWVKGQPSPNPSGRPKGLAAAIKARTSPEEIIEGFLSVAQDPRAKPAERIAAWRELADRGWGKAPAFAAIEGADPLDLSAMAAEVQAIADELSARRDARAAPDGAASVESASG